MFCWPCIIVYQYSETNVIKFSFNLCRASTCFEHYLLILRRRYTSNTWHDDDDDDDARDGAVGWGTALQVGRSQVRFTIGSLAFYIDVTLAAALWPWGRFSLWQKWVPETSPAGKGGRCVRLTTLPHSCGDCRTYYWNTLLGGSIQCRHTDTPIFTQYWQC
jgi:hypothetical protein